MQDLAGFIQGNFILVIAFAVTAGLIVWVEYQRLTKKYKDLSAQEMVQLINRHDPLLLDVREPSELNQGIIKGARHIPLADLSKRLSELGDDKKRKIAVYCRSGQRSSQACRILINQDFSDVYHLVGGVMAWESANLPLGKK